MSGRLNLQTAFFMLAVNLSYRQNPNGVRSRSLLWMKRGLPTERLLKSKRRLDFCTNSPIMLSTESDKISVADTLVTVFQTACHRHDKHPLLHKEQYS